ncbi:MAG: hypothetical protein LBM20_05185 [Rikenellaceae bacterium]|jgi:flavin reductase (DIM6/NTAB) family NADH-FMN oxidoreductase RutF|nr:hypothetical protein [Rikenellaceae bacterium]
MKRIIVTLNTLALAALLFAGCAGNGQSTEDQQQTAEAAATMPDREQIAAASFDELFKTITPEEIPGDVFSLVSKDLTVITAGTPELYNSMVAGWGGWGVLFSKPVTFCMLRSNRYTLELMRQDTVYTMAYFDEVYRPDYMPFGIQSGRDSKKMEETKLTAVQTPGGGMAFKEAKLIIECRLLEVTTVSPDDFLTDESRGFVVDAHAETGEYHKMVFGEVTNVWTKK